MFAVPDAFAGALPEATGLPEDDEELREQERREDGFGTEMRHPDVKASGKDDPRDQANSQI